jgi:hypothetical protein
MVRSDPRPGPPGRPAAPSRLARRGEACEPAGVPTKPGTAADPPLRGEPVARTVLSGVPALVGAYAQHRPVLLAPVERALRFLVCATGAVALAMVLAR